jgi:hypothetical protein
MSVKAQDFADCDPHQNLVSEVTAVQLILRLLYCLRSSPRQNFMSEVTAVQLILKLLYCLRPSMLCCNHADYDTSRSPYIAARLISTI